MPNVKDFILPPDIDATRDKTFTISRDALEGTARKALQKLGFNTPLSIDYLDDLPVAIGPFGLPVFDFFRVPNGRYTNINSEGVGTPVPYEGITVETCIVEASQQKNIVKTPVAGRDGIVKEYISSNDTSIAIRGAIVNSFSNAYPRSEVQRLVAICNIPQQIRVESKFINDILGFEYITIESWHLTTTPGTRNVQTFQINAVNDVSPETDETTAAIAAQNLINNAAEAVVNFRNPLT